jgi:hypothetical protein
MYLDVIRPPAPGADSQLGPINAGLHGAGQPPAVKPFSHTLYISYGEPLREVYRRVVHK